MLNVRGVADDCRRVTTKVVDLSCNILSENEDASSYVVHDMLHAYSVNGMDQSPSFGSKAVKYIWEFIE